MRERKVGLDSQCLSYLIDAAASSDEPTDSLTDEKKALLRSWFYKVERFYISETVISECARIRNVERRKLHESFGQVSYWGMPVGDPAAVLARVAQLRKIFQEENDCRVLAEAEDLGLDTLLTFDRDFRQKLAFASQIVALMTPIDYWVSLNIPKGARPQVVPYFSNPLSQQSWWRW